MRFSELPKHWQRIFELEWISLCEGSKAIAAVITDDEENIISEGRNMTGEHNIPNPAAAHAETEAIRALDTEKYPNKWGYTLHAGLEPCVMCMGTLVMGGIRRVEIAARDDFGGAMKLIDMFEFSKNKGIQVTWLDDERGDMQRAFQTLRELYVGTDEEKLGRMMKDFSVYNKSGVDAAVRLWESGILTDPRKFSAEEIFDRLADIMKGKEYDNN
ncbi:nucleoside deaminase [Ruminococcus albus]|uniref:MafB19-like deaminase n=1 Tax=Ruminococcus albus TaxID=1264 RepID=A0A1H7H7D0_RUMAL|nr:nucleoside deaminase [Ruminococcus albus]SEK46201.1 MafB19-like deaminase [Ruminococcus albus]